MSEETTLFKGSSSFVVSLGTFLLGSMIVVAAIVGAIVLSIWLLIVAGVTLILMAVRWIVIRSRTYELTTERVRVRTGIVNKRTDEMELYRVEDITLFEPLVQRLFGVGTIRIATNDTSTPTLEIEAIRGAAELREQLRKSVEACRDRTRVRVTEME